MPKLKFSINFPFLFFLFFLKSLGGHKIMTDFETVLPGCFLWKYVASTH